MHTQLQAFAKCSGHTHGWHSSQLLDRHVPLELVGLVDCHISGNVSYGCLTPSDCLSLLLCSLDTVHAGRVRQLLLLWDLWVNKGHWAASTGALSMIDYTSAQVFP